MELNKKNKTGYVSEDKPQNIGHSFFETHPIIPDVSVYSALEMINAFYKDKIAVDCLDLQASYRKMFDDAVKISRALKELGVRKGDIISVCMPNFYQAVAVFLACNRIGALTTFLNYGASNEELKEYLNTFESPIFVNFNTSNEENSEIIKNTQVKHIITLKESKINSLKIDDDYHITSGDSLIDFNSLGSIANFQKKGFSIGSAKNDSLILFTSGSTGKPKSVVLTNENILAAAIYLKNTSNVKSLNGDKTLVCVPFTYPYGFATSTLMSLMSSKTAILAPYMSKDTISYYLAKNPNIIFGSPALLDLIMKNVPLKQDLSSINTYISGGDFLTPSHNKRGKEFFDAHGAKNVEIGNGSGNAETVSCGTNPTGIEIRPETAGKILVGTDVMIIDPDTFEEKKIGEEGEMCVSGKHVFKEYYKDPIKTKEAKFVKAGKTYFRTGTTGFVDDDGYFTLTGRVSRFYIISTLNKVYCDHVQNIIDNIAEVDSCAIVPVPDDDMLYVNKAYIVLRPGYCPDESEKRHLIDLFMQPIINSNGETEQLKWYEIPSYIEFVSELPRRKGTDKIDYPLLEKDALKEKSQNKAHNLELYKH